MKRGSALFRFSGRVFSVSAARFVGIAITSLTFPFLVRKLGVETYGLWTYVVTVCAFLDTVANPGLSTYIAQQVAAKRQQAFESVADMLMLRVVTTLVAAVVLVAVAKLDPHPEVRTLLILYGLGILAVNLIGGDYLLGAMEMFHERSLLTMVQQCIYAAGVFLLVRKPSDVIWVPVSILFSALLFNIGSWLVLQRVGLRLKFRVRPDHWRPILVPSFHYALSSLMSNLYHRTGHLVVRWFLGPEALGIYSVAVRFVDILRNIINTIIAVLTPRLALVAQSASRLQRLARAAASALALITLPTMLGTIATAGLIVPLVLGKQSIGVAPLIQWMAPYVVTATAASFLTGLLYAMGLYKPYMYSTIAGAAVGVVLFLALTKMFGVVGAGMAFVLSELAVAIAAGLFLPNDFGKLWRNGVIVTAAIAALVMFAAVEAMLRYTARPIPVVAAGVLVYGVASVPFLRKWWTTEIMGATADTVGPPAYPPPLDS